MRDLQSQEEFNSNLTRHKAETFESVTWSFMLMQLFNSFTVKETYPPYDHISIKLTDMDTNVSSLSLVK